MHLSSLQVLKRHCARRVRVRHTDSVTDSVWWISILLLRYSMSDLRTMRCTSLGGLGAMADLRCCSGQMTSLTFPRQLFVRLFPFTLKHLPSCRHYATLCHMMNNSATISRTKAVRSSQCVF